MAGISTTVRQTVAYEMQAQRESRIECGINEDAGRLTAKTIKSRLPLCRRQVNKSAVTEPTKQVSHTMGVMDADWLTNGK